ncbi:hypothetical protein FNV43_RR01389 [Rhamnella rubrinervis]|uniref:Terpene synthase metal-binding domain-containing protein n=1 Tax=Rhamnella rubrinervis TaxID=2594499 RepID=A0A8K0HS69_9ROSA|nr:hypothetical protein FNV43_RR01389 [Rhamnella rubrinervis]
MELSLGSCGYSPLTTTSFLGMGDIATKEVFHWVSNGPRIVKASTICRLMDGVVDHKEHNKGHGDSASSGMLHEQTWCLRKRLVMNYVASCGCVEGYKRGVC